jgi:hypothetical protein
MAISLGSVSGSAMHGAVVPIAYATPTSTASFTNIPQIYQDLFIVIYSRDTASASTASLSVQFNGITTTTYSSTYSDGNGSSATSSRSSTQSSIGNNLSSAASATAGIFASNEFYILNYANTSTYKTLLARTAVDLNGSGNARLNVGLWQGTAAISRVDIIPQTAFASGTTVKLFGIRTIGQ